MHDFDPSAPPYNFLMDTSFGDPTLEANADDADGAFDLSCLSPFELMLGSSMSPPPQLIAAQPILPPTGVTTTVQASPSATNGRLPAGAAASPAVFSAIASQASTPNIVIPSNTADFLKTCSKTEFKKIEALVFAKLLHLLKTPGSRKESYLLQLQNQQLLLWCKNSAAEAIMLAYNHIFSGLSGSLASIFYNKHPKTSSFTMVHPAPNFNEFTPEFLTAMDELEFTEDNAHIKLNFYSYLALYDEGVQYCKNIANIFNYTDTSCAPKKSNRKWASELISSTVLANAITHKAEKMVHMLCQCESIDILSYIKIAYGDKYLYHTDLDIVNSEAALKAIRHFSQSTQFKEFIYNPRLDNGLLTFVTVSTSLDIPTQIKIYEQLKHSINSETNEEIRLTIVLQLYWVLAHEPKLAYENTRFNSLLTHFPLNKQDIKHLEQRKDFKKCLEKLLLSLSQKEKYSNRAFATLSNIIHEIDSEYIISEVYQLSAELKFSWHAEGRGETYVAMNKIHQQLFRSKYKNGKSKLATCFIVSHILEAIQRDDKAELISFLTNSAIKHKLGSRYDALFFYYAHTCNKEGSCTGYLKEATTERYTLETFNQETIISLYNLATCGEWNDKFLSYNLLRYTTVLCCMLNFIRRKYPDASDILDEDSKNTIKDLLFSYKRQLYKRISNIEGHTVIRAEIILDHKLKLGILCESLALQPLRYRASKTTVGYNNSGIKCDSDELICHKSLLSMIARLLSNTIDFSKLVNFMFLAYGNTQTSKNQFIYYKLIEKGAPKERWFKRIDSPSTDRSKYEILTVTFTVDRESEHAKNHENLYTIEAKRNEYDPGEENVYITSKAHSKSQPPHSIISTHWPKEPDCVYKETPPHNRNASSRKRKNKTTKAEYKYIKTEFYRACGKNAKSNYSRSSVENFILDNLEAIIINIHKIKTWSVPDSLKSKAFSLKHVRNNPLLYFPNIETSSKQQEDCYDYNNRYITENFVRLKAGELTWALEHELEHAAIPIRPENFLLVFLIKENASNFKVYTFNLVFDHDTRLSKGIKLQNIYHTKSLYDATENSDWSNRICPASSKIKFTEVKTSRLTQRVLGVSGDKFTPIEGELYEGAVEELHYWFQLAKKNARPNAKKPKISEQDIDQTFNSYPKNQNGYTLTPERSAILGARDYQLKAITKALSAATRHVGQLLYMPTNSGKTYTTLAAIREAISHMQSSLTEYRTYIVVVPTVTLIDNWVRATKNYSSSDFPLLPIACKKADELDSTLAKNATDHRIIVISSTSFATYIKASLQANTVQNKCCLIYKNKALLESLKIIEVDDSEKGHTKIRPCKDKAEATHLLYDHYSITSDSDSETQSMDKKYVNQILEQLEMLKAYSQGTLLHMNINNKVHGLILDESHNCLSSSSGKNFSNGDLFIFFANTLFDIAIENEQISLVLALSATPWPNKMSQALKHIQFLNPHFAIDNEDVFSYLLDNIWSQHAIQVKKLAKTLSLLQSFDLKSLCDSQRQEIMSIHSAWFGIERYFTQMVKIILSDLTSVPILERTKEKARYTKRDMVLEFSQGDKFKQQKTQIKKLSEKNFNMLTSYPTYMRLVVMPEHEEKLPENKCDRYEYYINNSIFFNKLSSELDEANFDDGIAFHLFLEESCSTVKDFLECYFAHKGITNQEVGFCTGKNKSCDRDLTLAQFNNKLDFNSFLLFYKQQKSTSSVSEQVQQELERDFLIFCEYDNRIHKIGKNFVLKKSAVASRRHNSKYYRIFNNYIAKIKQTNSLIFSDVAGVGAEVSAGRLYIIRHTWNEASIKQPAGRLARDSSTKTMSENTPEVITVKTNASLQLLNSYMLSKKALLNAYLLANITATPNDNVSNYSYCFLFNQLLYRLSLKNESYVTNTTHLVDNTTVSALRVLDEATFNEENVNKFELDWNALKEEAKSIPTPATSGQETSPRRKKRRRKRGQSNSAAVSFERKEKSSYQKTIKQCLLQDEANKLTQRVRLGEENASMQDAGDAIRIYLEKKSRYHGSIFKLSFTCEYINPREEKIETSHISSDTPVSSLSENRSLFAGSIIPVSKPSAIKAKLFDTLREDLQASICMDNESKTQRTHYDVVYGDTPTAKYNRGELPKEFIFEFTHTADEGESVPEVITFKGREYHLDGLMFGGRPESGSAQHLGSEGIGHYYSYVKGYHIQDNEAVSGYYVCNDSNISFCKGKLSETITRHIRFARYAYKPQLRIMPEPLINMGNTCFANATVQLLETPTQKESISQLCWLALNSNRLLNSASMMFGAITSPDNCLLYQLYQQSTSDIKVRLLFDFEKYFNELRSERLISRQCRPKHRTTKTHSAKEKNAIQVQNAFKFGSVDNNQQNDTPLALFTLATRGCEPDIDAYQWIKHIYDNTRATNTTAQVVIYIAVNSNGANIEKSRAAFNKLKFQLEANTASYPGLQVHAQHVTWSYLKEKNGDNSIPLGLLRNHTLQLLFKSLLVLTEKKFKPKKTFWLSCDGDTYINKSTIEKCFSIKDRCFGSFGYSLATRNKATKTYCDINMSVLSDLHITINDTNQYFGYFYEPTLFISGCALFDWWAILTQSAINLSETMYFGKTDAEGMEFTSYLRKVFKNSSMGYSTFGPDKTTKLHGKIINFTKFEVDKATTVTPNEFNATNGHYSKAALMQFYNAVVRQAQGLSTNQITYLVCKNLQGLFDRASYSKLSPKVMKFASMLHPAHLMETTARGPSAMLTLLQQLQDVLNDGITSFQQTLAFKSAFNQCFKVMPVHMNKNGLHTLTFEKPYYRIAILIIAKWAYGLISNSQIYTGNKFDGEINRAYKSKLIARITKTSIKRVRNEKRQQRPSTPGEPGTSTRPQKMARYKQTEQARLLPGKRNKRPDDNAKDQKKNTKPSKRPRRKREPDPEAMYFL